MSEQLHTGIRLIDDKTKFKGQARENPEVVIDYFPPIGSGEGYTSLELLMLSFTSCVSATLLTVLRGRMGKTITAMEAGAAGTLREEHPLALSCMEVTLHITSPDVEESEIIKALELLEEKFCPVWAMLKGNVEIKVTPLIQRPAS